MSQRSSVGGRPTTFGGWLFAGGGARQSQRLEMRFSRVSLDREAVGDPVTLPDGTKVPRLGGFRRWLWDGEFCGSIGFRWQPGTEALPPHCLGHIGYAVVPWKQGRGYATRALGEMLREAKAEGLRYVDITTQPDNVPSQRVITANGGVLLEEFVTPPALGGKRELRVPSHIDGDA